MVAKKQQDEFRIAFLAAQECASSVGTAQELGYVGGLLVTNHLGRPLEFQCTMPVRPNRIQTILYGDSLVPFLLGELIGSTLVERLAIKPHLILIEQPDLQTLQHQMDIPLGQLIEQKVAGESLMIGQTNILLQTAETHELKKQTQLVPAEADLREPFLRVREALGETIQSGAAA